MAEAVGSKRPRRDERRLTANLHLYWHSLARDGELPKLVAFNPQTIPALWPSCVLVIKEGSDSAPFIGDVGALLKADCPNIRPGLEATQVPEKTLAGQALGCLENTIRKRTAFREEGRFRHQSGDEMRYRAISLPFLDVHGHLTYVLCAASGKRA